MSKSIKLSFLKQKKVIVLSLLVIAVVLDVWLVLQFVIPQTYSGYNELIKKYPLLSKRILNENENDLLIYFVPLRQQLRQEVAEYGSSFAFYFEYLPTGISIGVNEKTDYDVNSLLKLPLVMAYYNQIERQGFATEQPVTIAADEIDNQFGSLWQQGVGAQISLKEAARLALVDSDNTAARVLAKNVSNQDYTEVYNGLDIELPTDISNPVKLSAKGYSSILKSLYFSSILNRGDSQTILDFLTKTNFSDKLPAGVPQGIRVAHKIGVLDGQIYQDCGIIYEPQRPYILCLFANSSEGIARDRMTTISSLVYQYVHKSQ